MSAKGLEKPIVVAIVGGGIGGLTVAHELAERGGFKITVYEKTNEFGGQARSMLSPDGFPAEHAPHVVAYFYFQLRDTMRRIPLDIGNVLENNVRPVPAGSRGFYFFKDHEIVALLNYIPLNRKGFAEYRKAQKDFFEIIPEHDMKIFIRNLIKSLFMSNQKRFQELENRSWHEYFNKMGLKSEGAHKYLYRLPEFIIAAAEAGMSNAKVMATLAGKLFLAPFLYPIGTRYSFADIFNAPSSDALFKPWVNYLRKLGVEFKLSTEVRKINIESKKISNVSLVDKNNIQENIVSDIYVFAIGLPELIELTRDKQITSVVPSLKNLDKLQLANVAGMQFFDAEENEMKFPGGWMLFMDSPWSIIAIYQSKRLWPETKINPPVKGILSVNWSNFNNPGILYNKPAKECTAQEIKDEIWAQIKMHKNTDIFIKSFKLHSWYIEPDLIFAPNAGPMVKTVNPVFCQNPGCWQNQPSVNTEVDNFFLASAFVRTTFDMATMEAANEAGRRAANAILARYKSKAKPCFVLDNPVSPSFPVRLFFKFRNSK